MKYDELGNEYYPVISTKKFSNTEDAWKYLLLANGYIDQWRPLVKQCGMTLKPQTEIQDFVYKCCLLIGAVNLYVIEVKRKEI